MKVSHHMKWEVTILQPNLPVEELQLNQEVVEKDFKEELKDHTMKPKPKTMIEYTLFDHQRGKATVRSSQK